MVNAQQSRGIRLGFEAFPFYLLQEVHKWKDPI